MKGSLQMRVSVFITLIILLISTISTYLFISVHSKSKEQGLEVRGTALAYALAKAAEEGLVKEDLNLIKKSSYIVQAPDVTLAQVYSNIWAALDAYPITNIKEPPHPEAVKHFQNQYSSFRIRTPGSSGYDFYYPIFFKAFEDSSPAIIGFVRITLSSGSVQKEIRKIVIINIIVSIAMTFLAILALNMLMHRLVINPVMALHRSIARFKSGAADGTVIIPAQSTGEIRELSLEFDRMCKTVREDEKKLIESDRRIRSLFDRVEHAIFRIDTHGTIVEANSRFSLMFGSVSGLCDIIIGDISADTCLTKAASGKALHIEDKAVAHDGEEMIISLSLYPEYAAAGGITGFDGYIIDITEKKRMEERLMRSQKLEAVGTLAAGMAHDFNNILTAILGYSGIMIKALKDDDAFYKPVSIIHDAAKRGAELGKKILTITRKEKISAKQVNINEIILTAVDLLRRSIPKNIEIVTKLREALPLTVADPSQLQQVILNLVVNARDAMPDGGKVTLETTVVAPGNGFANNPHTPAQEYIKMSVSDTGEGIDADTQSKIFDPFFTTKEVGKGTGLGLYIVHSVISNHGGYINVYSEPRKGTQFNLYLPLAKSTVTEGTFVEVDIAGTETILVIDDEPHVRDLCNDMLTSLGYRVLVAGSGNAGISLYREKKSEISLVILDMIMPRKGGNEVFAALKTINNQVKILLYSGYSHNNYAGISELLEQGASGFIQKPFSLQDIGIAIRNALGH